MTEVAPPPSLATPLTVPHKLLMGPGPANAPPRVLAAGALPMLGHLHSEFVQIMDEVKAGIQYAFQTRNRLTLAISGTGHAAMEAACVNTVEASDRVLIGCYGIWGSRFADMCKRQGASVIEANKLLGTAFSYAEIEEQLRIHRPTVMFLTHGESSSGVLQPLEGVGLLCHRYDCILIVDAVASLGGVPMYMDRWGIDVLYTGSQKVLSCPPGPSPISFSERAWDKLQKRVTPVTSFYLDMNYLANYWGCDDQPRKYHHTGPIHSVYALREGLAMLAEEGLVECWARHKRCTAKLYEGLQKLGLTLLVTDESFRLPTVTTINVPPGVDWRELIKFAMQKYKLEIAGGLGPSAGKVWRVGVMGYNANDENIRRVLAVFKEGLQVVGFNNAKL